jgi:hypothetical protein
MGKQLGAAKPAAPTKQTAFMDKQLMAAKQAASTGKQVGTAQKQAMAQQALLQNQPKSPVDKMARSLGRVGTPTMGKTFYEMSTQKQLQDARNAPATFRAPRAPTGKPSTTQARPTTPYAGASQLAGAGLAAMMGKKPGMKKGGSVKHSDVAMDKKVVKKAVKMHDDQLHGGKKTNLTKLKAGGMTCGTKRLSKGGGIETKGKTKGRMC